MTRVILLVTLLAGMVLSAFAQPDNWAGTWLCVTPMSQPVKATLKIAHPHRDVLYPALLTLECGSFTGSYQLLLVKKSSRELVMSKNKLAVSESPFNLGGETQWFTGLLDYGRNQKGNPVISFRSLLKQQITAKVKPPKKEEPLATLLSWLALDECQFEKNDGIPLADEAIFPILTPSLSPAYFGLSDTIYVPTKDAQLHLSSTNKADQISVSLHGKNVLDRIALNRKKQTEDILLDTGLNLLVLFNENGTDNYLNKSHAMLETGTKKTTLHFANPGDSGAAFIVAQIFFEREKSKETFFEDNANDNKPLQANEKKLGSVITYSSHLTLAVWDDAQFDGDSITIRVNDKIIRTGFLVKKHPQYIEIPLQKGPNSITFIADNVGSIPPNTAVLEIIDGLRRRSFMLETVPGEKSLINILYNNSF